MFLHFSLSAGFVHHVFILCICLTAYSILSACGLQRHQKDSRICQLLFPYLCSLGDFRLFLSLLYGPGGGYRAASFPSKTQN